MASSSQMLFLLTILCFCKFVFHFHLGNASLRIIKPSFKIMEQTDARIILSLVSNKQMRELQKSNPSAERLAQMQKIWIYLDIGGTIAEGDVNSLDFLINGNISTSLQVPFLS